MSSSGVIMLNLENRNAAEFEAISVPGSYDKALGAATAGSYITVYKWLYNGFIMAASLCTAEDKTEYISLVDKTKGGELKVYSDDTITLVGAAPPPEDLHFKAYHVYSGSTTSPYTFMVQRGHFVGTEFSTDWTPEDFIEDGEPIEIAASTYDTKPYVCEGALAITYASGWILTSSDYAHEYGVIPNQWAYFAPNITLELVNSDASWSGRYYCANTGTPVEDSEP